MSLKFLFLLALVVLATIQSVAAECGNGILEEGEQCDSPQPCCTSTCTFESTEVKCRAASGQCDADDYCSGKHAACGHNHKKPNGSPCKLENAPWAHKTMCKDGKCVGDERVVKFRKTASWSDSDGKPAKGYYAKDMSKQQKAK